MNSSPVLLSGLLALLFIASTAEARKISFASAKTFASGMSQPSHVAVGDFNGDGFPDIAVGNDFNNISIFLGNGDGTFGAPTTYTLTFYVTGTIAVADFNNDSKLDLAIVGGDTSGHGLAFMAGRGDGTFAPPTYFTTTLAGASIFSAVGDFNNDHQLDLFVGGNGSSEVILGDGNGNFHDGQIQAVAGFSVAVGDFNKDGNLDVATTIPYPNQYAVAVLLGNGDGTFKTPQIYSLDDEPGTVAAADFNRDKKLDLAISLANTNSTLILLGNGDGTFTTGSRTFAGYTPYYEVPADFNLDGKVDLAMSDFGGTGITVLPGKGDGTFGLPTNFQTDSRAAAMVAADFNQDGSVDLVVTNYFAGDVSVLLNAAGTRVQLTSSLNPSQVGQPVTFTATVQGSVIPSPVPSGAVVFKDGSNPLGRVLLSQGQASFTTSALGKGTHKIQAKYSGNGTFNPNHSAVLVQTVQ